MGRLFLIRSSTITSICLTLALFGQAASGAESARHSGKGRLATAIDRNIQQLVTPPSESDEKAAAPEQKKMPAAPFDWRRVTKLAPGVEFDIRTGSGTDGRRSFVFADDSELTALHLTHPALPSSTRKQLRQFAIDQPASLLAAKGRTIATYRDITVGNGAVSVSGRRIAALDEVLQTIPRADVRDIRVQRIDGSKLGAIGGAAAGAVAGFALAPYFLMKPCGRSCGDEQFLLPASLVGLPVAGALLGYAPRRHEVIVYRSDDNHQ